MFFQLAYHFSHSLQQTVLVINTVLLIVVLIIIELVYAEASPEKRQPLKFFLPIILVLVGLLIYAAVKQIGGS